MSDKIPDRGIIERLKETATNWLTEYKSLNANQRWTLIMRSVVPGLPVVGPFIDQHYYGTREAHIEEKTQATLRYLTEKLDAVSHDALLAIQPDYFKTAEFAATWEDCWRRILAEEQLAKLQALRGALVSIVTQMPDYSFEKKQFFIRSMDYMSDVDIYIMQVYQERRQRSADAYISVAELYELLNVADEATRDFVYSVLDVLANRRFIIHGNIPQGKEGRIDYPKQRFALTALGVEFLEFVRADDIAQQGLS